MCYVLSIFKYGIGHWIEVRSIPIWKGTDVTSIQKSFLQAYEIDNLLIKKLSIWKWLVIFTRSKEKYYFFGHTRLKSLLSVYFFSGIVGGANSYVAYPYAIKLSMWNLGYRCPRTACVPKSTGAWFGTTCALCAHGQMFLNNPTFRAILRILHLL